MKSRTRALTAMIFVSLLNFTIASAEDLHVVRCGSISIDKIDSVEEVEVYAAMNGLFLIGTIDGSAYRLREEGLVEIVKSLGELDRESEYYMFQLHPEDISRLPSGADLLFFSGKYAIVRVESGSDFADKVECPIWGMTLISFTPRLHLSRETSVPAYDTLFDPAIEEVVSQVSEVEYTANIQRLQDFRTRHSSTDSCRAALDWAIDTFAGLGLDTDLFPFGRNANIWHNSVGRKDGTTYPDSIYMVVGHIDSRSEDPLVYAPGAEDNGSGSAAVLEAARVLSQYDFACTLEFALFSGEEQGLLGSAAYAIYCSNDERNIAGIINLDMISYAGSHGWDSNIYADQNSPAQIALADLFAQLTDEYTDAYSVRVDTDGPQPGSDHVPFARYGMPAVFAIDSQLWGAPDWYPWYHTTGDQISRLDLDYGTEVVKSAVATLATLAGLEPAPVLEFDYPNGIPSMVDQAGGTTFRVEVTAGTADPQSGTGMLYFSTGGPYTGIPMEVVAPGIYDAVFPATDCGLDINFYLSAETIESVVVNDPPTAPERIYSSSSAYRFAQIYTDDFSTNRGWTGLGGPMEWTIGPAVGGRGDDTFGSSDPSLDTSPSEDNQVLGNDLTLEDGDYEAQVYDTYWATSPIIDCSDYFGVRLEFFRWLGIDKGEWDYAFMEVFDGTDWVTLFRNGSLHTNDAGWRPVSYDVSFAADGNPDFQIRFGLGKTNWGVEYCGWNIDDVDLSGYSCSPPPDLTVDLIPDEDPAIVPQGGSFGMTKSITNNGTAQTTTDVWMGAYAGTRWFQLHLFPQMIVEAGETIEEYFVQDVPFATPPGDYVYVEFCGDYETWSVVDSAFFEVTVTGAMSAHVR